LSCHTNSFSSLGGKKSDLSREWTTVLRAEKREFGKGQNFLSGDIAREGNVALSRHQKGLRGRGKKQGVAEHPKSPSNVERGGK